MTPGELKPVFAALVLPPAGPLLLALAGGLLALAGRRRAGIWLALLASASLWLLSCHAVAMALAGSVLPQVAPLQLQTLQRVQAIVVLGGGVLPQAPEYGAAQPSAHTLARLRYGAWLARRSGLPLAFAGGVGWAAVGGDEVPAEAEVAARSLQGDFGLSLRWSDGRSRDTAENALQMKKLLGADRIDRIALVTDAWHMPRAVQAFEVQGFTVLPAPTGFASAQTRPLLAWLPSAEGLSLSRQVLREALALQVGRW